MCSSAIAAVNVASAAIARVASAAKSVVNTPSAATARAASADKSVVNVDSAARAVIASASTAACTAATAAALAVTARPAVKYNCEPSVMCEVVKTTTPVWPLTLSTVATELIIPVAGS